MAAQAAPLQLIDDRQHAVREDGHLLRLEHHREDARALHGLEVEDAVARLADGTGGEAVWGVEVDDAAGHARMLAEPGHFGYA